MSDTAPTVAEVLDGLILSPDDFEGRNPQEDVGMDEIISKCMEIAEKDGATIEGRGRECGNGTFHCGGDAIFSFTEEEGEDGEPCLMIELEEEMSD